MGLSAFKIWFSNNPHSFMPEINRIRLKTLRDKAPALKISLLINSKPLETAALEEMGVFAEENNIIIIDLMELKDALLFDEELNRLQNRLVEGAQLELDKWLWKEGGNPAAAADIMRWAPSLLNENSFYSDLDIPLLYDLSMSQLHTKDYNKEFVIYYNSYSDGDFSFCNNILFFRLPHHRLLVLKNILRVLEKNHLQNIHNRLELDTNPALLFSGSDRLIQNILGFCFQIGDFLDEVAKVLEGTNPIQSKTLTIKRHNQYFKERSIETVCEIVGITDLSITPNDLSWGSRYEWGQFSKQFSKIDLENLEMKVNKFTKFYREITELLHNIEKKKNPHFFMAFLFFKGKMLTNFVSYLKQEKFEGTMVSLRFDPKDFLEFCLSQKTSLKAYSGMTFKDIFLNKSAAKALKMRGGASFLDIINRIAHCSGITKYIPEDQIAPPQASIQTDSNPLAEIFAGSASFFKPTPAAKLISNEKNVRLMGNTLF